MKPNFALTLSFEGIGLLHRAFPGWHMVGDIALDDADLLGALTALRDTAVALDPSGLRSKLVIPNDQIRYVSFEAQDLSEDDLTAAVETHLDGATPYPLDDLAYDWTRDDDGVIMVAAVARETLREAEAFAKEHRFNPVCFVAIPDTGDFAGEPYFGETAHFADIAPGESIERDPVPVRVIGTARLPDPAEEPPVAIDDTPPAPELPAPEPAAPPASPTEAALEDEDEQEPEALLDELLDIAPITDAPQDSTTPGFAEPESPFDTPEATRPVAEDGASDTATSPEVPTEADADATAFSSIRARRGHPPTTAPKLDGVARHFSPVHVSSEVLSDHLPIDLDDDGLPPEPSITSETAADIPAVPAMRAAPSATPSETGAFSTRRTAPIAPHVPKAAPRPTPEPPSAIPPSPPIAKPIVTPAASAARVAAAAPGYAAHTLEEEQRMTVFGARDAAAIGGKPRYLGLILTAVLLAFLVGVAAWASIFLDDGLAGFFRDDREIQIAEVPAVPKPDAEAEATTSEPQDTVIAALPQPLEGADEGLQETLTQPKPTELTEDEARARYAATGIWLVAPDTPLAPKADTLEGFYHPAEDRAVTRLAALPLPEPDFFLGDARPITPSSPAAKGTTFDFDDRGLVQATTRGAVTPDGILIFAGQPPKRPVAMPKRAVIAAQETPQADPSLLRLAAFRPKTRPGDFAIFATPDTPEEAAPDDDTLAEIDPVEALPEPDTDTDAIANAIAEATPGEEATAENATSAEAGLRPKTRPQSLEARAAEIAQQQAPEPEVQEAAVKPFIDLDAVNSAVTEAVETETVFASALPQAVASSLKPNTRPRDFDSIVQRSTQSQETAIAVSATQRVAPRIPTTTTVAKQATQRNVLKLRKINLIGVYGAPNSRRALVRLSNGRYRKVQVGDRLDGGKVSAIQDGELRYQKGGRSLVLKMPKG